MYTIQYLTKSIILLQFKTKKDITSTMLRFQEYYESPEFKNKIFTLDEFKEWYIKNSKGGKEHDEFTYYQDWSGFNVPDYCFEPFINGDFNPLSRKEQNLVNDVLMFKKPFYVIAIYKDSTLLHEMKHGLFYTNSDYKEEVLKALSKYKLKKQTKQLLEMGYHEDLIKDELQAYIEILPNTLIRQLIRIYRKYVKIECGI